MIGGQTKSKPKSKSILYVKLKSLDDLCRYACNFDYTNSSIMAIKSGSVYRIFSIGETIGSATMAYYVNSSKKEGVISYTYPSPDVRTENSHFLEFPGHQQNHYMNIINISRASFRDAKVPKDKELCVVELSGPSDLIKAVIKRGVSSESIPQIYRFDYRGKTVLCCFDVIDELSDDTRTIYFTVTENARNGNFARYKYGDNEIDFTDYMGEHSYMYAKIISLAEPFPFFKMPE